MENYFNSCQSLSVILHILLVSTFISAKCLSAALDPAIIHMCWKQVSFAIGEMQALSYPLSRNRGVSPLGVPVGGGTYPLHQWCTA